MLTKTIFSAIGLSLSINIYSTAKSTSLPSDRHAISIINPCNESNTRGIVSFSQESLNSPTKIVVNLTGLKPNGFHALYISDIYDPNPNDSNEIEHFNPLGKKHGGVLDEERHVGDLGNIKTDERGNGFWATKDHLVSLFGEQSVIGRGCCVGENKDEGNKGDGKTGKIIGIGVIALSKNFKNGPPL